MITSMAASHAADKRLNDVIFGAGAAAKAAIAKFGADKVVNATIGMMIDDEENLACMPTLERVYRSLPLADIAAYAPIAGLPDYLDAVAELAFAQEKPEGYIAAVATAGGTGAIHHAVANYAERGDKVLTSDWFWGAYSAICHEAGCTLVNYALLDGQQKFNLSSFSENVAALMAAQDSLLIIINTPAHNPTGFSLSETEWQDVLGICKEYAKKGKRISILVDIAYIDYAGEKQEVRRFMRQFSHLPENILIMFAFSMSKGYSLYGQRTGALLAVSSSKPVIDEFREIAKYSGRATWSNINRGAMALLTALWRDSSAQQQFEKERDAFYQLTRSRAAIFMNEAKEAKLNAVPYHAGFFLALPSSNPAAVCEKLHDDLIFAVPLKLGVRIAACSVPTRKMSGVAAKVKKAWDAVEGKQ